MRRAPNMVSSSMLKLCRAVELTTTSSIGRTRATGNPPLAWRNCSLTAEMNWCGSVWVRTSQTTGPNARVEGGHAIGHLCLRERSSGERIPV